MIKSIRIITAASYSSMLFLGISSSVIGAAARNIGLTPFEIGLMIAFQNIGFMISVLASGALADRLEKPRILLVGSLILSPALLTFYLSHVFEVNLLLMFLIGVGIGAYEGVTDAMLMEIHPRRAALHININHFFVTAGSLLITLYLIFLQMGWRNAVIQAGVLVLVLAIVFFLIRMENPAARAEPYFQKIRLLTRERLIITFFIATITVVGVEAGSIGVMTTFLMDLRGFSQVTSKIGLVIFLAGIAVGRILLGALTPKESISRYILVLFAASTLIFAVLYLINLGPLTYLAIFLAGLATSALLPLMLAYTGLVYRNMVGTALSSIKVAIPLGGILLPFLMSLVVRFADFQASLWVFPMAFFISLILLLRTLGQGDPIALENPQVN
jgi:fucose permease